MKKAFFLLLLYLFAFSIVCRTQTRYLAAYEQKMAIDLSVITLNAHSPINSAGFDSSSAVQDSVLRLLKNRDFILQMLKEKLGDTVTVYSHVWADATKAELEYNAGDGVNVQVKKKYENGTWKHLDSLTRMFVPDSIKYGESFVFLDSTKMIAGYACKKAQSKGPAQIIVWYCKEFPQTVSPGVTIDKIKAAIFELIDDDRKMHIVLRSIQKLKP